MTWNRREGEWVGAVTRIVHAGVLEHTDYHYYVVTACGLRGDSYLPAFHTLRDPTDITCLRCWAEIVRTGADIDE